MTLEWIMEKRILELMGFEKFGGSYLKGIKNGIEYIYITETDDGEFYRFKELYLTGYKNYSINYDELNKYGAEGEID
jgi:hypothetical protein|tara:strand:- start:2064 stop:2294 length:231 start_codon:yes stop_codon:yes gene_type:complete